MELDTQLTDLRWAAYMLATVKHECADTWQPITERGPRAYFDKYEPNRAAGRSVGNTDPGDGWRFRGRGYVQLTGRRNYARATQELGLAPDADLIENPDQSLRPAIAYPVMSLGMRHGWFTGKKLSDYINADGCDYVNARRIINGLDRASTIKGYAETIEAILRQAAIP